MEYTFTTYNIFKLRLPFCRQYVGYLEKNTDFLAVQEWVESLHVKRDKFIFSQATFTLPIKQEKTGTAIISSYKPTHQKGLLSVSSELGFLTSKSATITSYNLENKVLTILNCHSLNFVTNSVWEKTIDHWLDHLPANGPCIVAGDFNTWNPWRFDLLEKKLQSLGFLYAHYDHNLIMRLDHIWHRDIIPTFL